MAYKLVISEYADKLLDNLIYYLIYRLKNEQAARHLLDGIDVIYDRLETNPFQFPISRDGYLAKVLLAKVYLTRKFCIDSIGGGSMDAFAS